MRRFLKITAILLVLALAAGLVALGILYQSGDLHRRAREAVVKLATGAFDGEIEFGRISGSLLQTLQIEDLRLFRGADTLLQVDTLRCRWRPISLLWGHLTLHRVEFIGTRIAVHQAGDGSWNYERYLRNAGEPSGREWTLQLKSLRLRDTAVRVQPSGDSPAPVVLRIPNLAAGARLSPAGWRIGLEEAEVSLPSYGIRITRVQAKAAGNERGLVLDLSHLETTASRIKGSLEAAFGPGAPVTITLHADSLAAADIAPVTGWSPPFARMGIDIRAAGYRDSIAVEVKAGAPEGNAELKGWLKPAEAAAGRLILAGVQTAALLGRSGELRAVVDFAGSGFNPAEAQWQARGRMHHSLLDTLALGEIGFDAHLAGSTLSLLADAPAGHGRIRASGRLRLEQDPQYDLHLTTEGVNLADWSERPGLASSLNLDLHLEGRGLNGAGARASARLAGHPSVIAGFVVDSLYAAGWIKPAGIELDTLQLTAPGLKAEGRGSWSTDGPLSAGLTLTLTEHTSLPEWLGADSMRLNGTVLAALSGTTDSLALSATARLRESAYEAFRIGKITADLDGLWNGRPQAALRLSAASLHSGESALADSFYVDGRYDDGLISAESAMTLTDSLSARIVLQAARGDSLWEFKVPGLELREHSGLWRLDEATPKLTLGDRSLALAGLTLRRGEERIELGGTLSLDDSLDFILNLEKMDLQRWSGLLPGLPALSGALNIHSTLQGTASCPRIVTTIRAEALKVAGLPLATLQFSSLFEDSLLIWDGTLTQSASNTLLFSGLLPLRLRWPLPQILIADTDSIDIAVRTRELQSGLLSAFLPGIDLRGTLSGDLLLTHTWKEPRPGGYLELRNGSFIAPYLGRPYAPITARIELEPDRIVLSRLNATGGEGRLQGDGFWRFDLTDKGLEFGEMLLRLKSDRFTAADGPEITLVLDGTVELSGLPAGPLFNGALRIERSRIDLPAFTESPSTLMQADLPLLMVTRGDTASQSYDRKILQPAWLPLVERLRGSIRLDIPRNTWLRSPEMNIEISGKLDLAKEGEQFGLFGSIEIVRGNYDLFSRRFDIKEGRLTFAGGDNLPEMTLQADHLFRSQDKSKHTLSLTASGELRKPLLSFTLDDQPIAESDAVSYLAFGRSFADLTHGERNDLVASQLQISGDAFRQMLAGQIAGEVTRSLQQTLDLDVIEFRGDQNWRQSTVVVGKYLTNDLFISYERQLNFKRTSEVAPEQVTLEYEIIPSLFLQATRGDENSTGIDLIYKWEK